MTPRCGPSTVRASCCSSSTTPSHLVWNGSEDRPSDESGNCDLRKESRPARGRNPPGRSPLWSTAPSTTQLCARTVLARLGQRAVYSWKVQVPQTSLLLRWTLVSSTASTRKPCQSRPGAVSRSRVSVSSTSSVSHAPVSAKVSSACQSSGRFRASTDWVMVCSSTFNAKPVTHSTKRFHPGVVKHVAKGRSNSCHSDQNKRACIGHLSSARIRSGQGPSDMIRLRGVRVDHCDHLMLVRLLKIPGNYCLKTEEPQLISLLWWSVWSLGGRHAAAFASSGSRASTSLLSARDKSCVAPPRTDSPRRAFSADIV